MCVWEAFPPVLFFAFILVGGGLSMAYIFVWSHVLRSFLPWFFPLGTVSGVSCPPQKLDFWSFVLVVLNSDSHGLLSAASFPRPWLSLTTNCSCYTFSCGSPTPRMSTGYKTSWAKCILKIWFFIQRVEKGVIKGTYINTKAFFFLSQSLSLSRFLNFVYHHSKWRKIRIFNYNHEFCHP